MVTAQEQIKTKAEEIINKFKTLNYTNSDEVINDYRIDISSFIDLPEEFLFKSDKSDGHKKLSEMFINGYEHLDLSIKKQYKKEFFKNVEKRCPFCGQLLESSGKADSDVPTADLDHFFPKFEYPQFSLLPQNLIPTCMECNRIEKHRKSILPSEFKLALEELGLLKIFQQHPNSHFKLYTSLSFDCNNKLFLKTNNEAIHKLIKLYGLNERYHTIKGKCFNILWSIVRYSNINSVESLERLLENMASNNWHEINDGYSLNNSPQIWQEFIENILYDECKLMALWDEVKSSELSFL
ncbi:hypothetical protein J6E39_08110 [bacterium]|nr:hypothetical protein [bacterium]